MRIMMSWAAIVLMLMTPVSASEKQSELAQAMSAALKEIYAQPGWYAKLYEEHLGVRRDPPSITGCPDWVAQPTSGSTLDVVLKRGVLKIGFYRHRPYYYTTPDGHDTGFELTLGNEIAKRISRHYGVPLRVQWLEESFTLKGGGQDNIDLYDKLLPDLQNGTYDVVMSGLIVFKDRPVSASCPTMDFFWTALYTGKGNLNAQLKSVQSTNRATFVRWLAAHSGRSLISTEGGPSQEAVKKLVTDVAAAGGKVTANVTDVKGLINIITDKKFDFLIGDAIALAGESARKNFDGLNLNISLRDYDPHVIAPITRLDPKR